jgi:lipopolysaccharide/colanic/teichoic acid biosynthesis glycosyltransferase
MKHDAENTATGPVFKLRSDPRVSRVGRFLRKTSLDELPALLNVIRGSMSIVGPRAALPLEAEHYSEVQRKRLELKPGLTGYWQVFGRAQEANTLDKMVQMDLEYADKQSLLFDLKILIRTVAVGLTRNAAQ